MTGAADGTPALGDVEIAGIGGALADPARCRMLLALDDGRALPAGTLAEAAGVTAPTASSHLAKLVEAGLVVVSPHGRRRYYRLAGPEVAELIEMLMRLGTVRPVTSLKESTRARHLRTARTCYDHLAGRLGVGLMASMLERGHLVGGDGRHHPDTARVDGPTGYGRDVDYRVTPEGWELMASVGVEVPPGRRPLVRYCVDWTEQRHHLAGRLGRSLWERFRDQDWVRPRDRDRSVEVTSAGERAFAEHFGLSIDRAA